MKAKIVWASFFFFVFIIILMADYQQRSITNQIDTLEVDRRVVFLQFLGFVTSITGEFVMVLAIVSLILYIRLRKIEKEVEEIKELLQSDKMLNLNEAAKTRTTTS